ncbi:MAG: hypothetical protein LRY63_04955 [Nitrincola sp.]|nr:hypothetical protein [Nitrincola sp.]
MFAAHSVILIILLYVLLLFGLAILVERRTRYRSSSVMPGWVYALSLAVFFTSWTFYGSVGFAVNSGMLFLAIYIGALLSVIFWWVTLRRIVASKKCSGLPVLQTLFRHVTVDRSELLLW